MFDFDEVCLGDANVRVVVTLLASIFLGRGGSGPLKRLGEVKVRRRRWGSGILGKRAGRLRKKCGIPTRF